jgi:hypothetical protein
MGQGRKYHLQRHYTILLADVVPDDYLENVLYAASSAANSGHNDGTIYFGFLGGVEEDVLASTDPNEFNTGELVGPRIVGAVNYHAEEDLDRFDSREGEYWEVPNTGV